VALAIAREKLPRGDYMRARFMVYAGGVLEAVGRKGEEVMVLYEEAVETFQNNPTALSGALCALGSQQER